MQGNFYEDFARLNVKIDRDQENKDVLEYQKTKDIILLEKIFYNRVPTLKYWTKQHYFPGIALSKEDFYGEMISVFVKAIDGFKSGKGSFNTCLYTFLSNRIKNIKSGKYAKKRKPEGYEGPLSGIMLSMDYVYGDDSNKPMTLGEQIENKDSQDHSKHMNSVYFDDSVELLSGGNSKLKEIFVKIGNGTSLNSILKEFNTRHGEIKLHSHELTNKGKYDNKYVIERIKEIFSTESFKLVNYTVEENGIKYVIELQKSAESDMVSKAVRKLKKNKDYYLSTIKSNKI